MPFTLSLYLSTCRTSSISSTLLLLPPTFSLLLKVFEHLRDIIDPEHPYTLEQLNVVSEEQVEVNDAKGRIRCGGLVEDLDPGPWHACVMGPGQVWTG